MELMLSGKPSARREALRLGLIDRLVPEAELRSAARAMLLAAPAPRRAPWQERLLSSALLRPLVRRALTRKVARRAPASTTRPPTPSLTCGRGSAHTDLRRSRRKPLDCAPVHYRNLAQPGARVPVAGSPESTGGKSGADIRHVHVVAPESWAETSRLVGAARVHGHTADRAIEYVSRR